MSTTLDDLVASGVLAPLDLHLARTLAGLVDESAEEVLLAAAFASRAVQRGHVCVDLPRLADGPLLDVDEQPVSGVELPDPERWRQALGTSPLVADLESGGVAGPVDRPLVVEASRVYLARYWRYQQRLASAIHRRAAAAEDVDESLLTDGLERLFGPGEERDQQRAAAELAARRRLAVISGGPGTGKTTTVVRLLATLQEQAIHRQRPALRVMLLAPTGKAAQRLGDAVERSLQGLDCDDDVRRSIPFAASTIHRALGYQRRSPTRFRHDRDNPLPADVVVVDEASMVDLALMAKLVDAVPSGARLVLLGDRHQLASVEAGAILGDLCAAADEADGPLAECVVHLERSYRYDPDSGIARLASAVNHGDADAAVGVLRAACADVRWVEPVDATDAVASLQAVVVEGFGSLSEGDPARRLEQLGRLRILCAHRRGPLGVEEINRLIESRLREAGRLGQDGEWYDGRPVMITRNDYQLDLFNGDVGIVAPGPGGDSCVVWFPGRDKAEELRSFHPGRLPPHETVYATTVHKSQGSEFDRVVLVSPAEVSPVLTRELVYTGITRAREEITLIGSEAVLRAAIARRIERASGLRAALRARAD